MNMRRMNVRHNNASNHMIGLVLLNVYIMVRTRELHRALGGVIRRAVGIKVSGDADEAP